jgi:hypothetical protein
MRGKRVLVALAVVMLAVTGVGWLGRDGVKARYYSHRLWHAADRDETTWVEQAAGWGDGVAARLVAGLERDDAVICNRSAAALANLAGSWLADDPRHTSMALQIADHFGSLSPPGRSAVFGCVAVLAEGGQTIQSHVRRIVRVGLDDGDADVRLRAAALALRPNVGAAALLVPLLKDPSASVRRAAVLAVGPSRELVSDDDLLPWLHDTDAEVRRLCELALRGRGLRQQDVRLGRLLTDPQPSARLRLLALLGEDAELDPAAWLQRLSQDPSPAVRAGAARFAGERHVLPLIDRLAQMADADPDLTVRPIARYHWRQLLVIRPVVGSGPN